MKLGDLNGESRRPDNGHDLGDLRGHPVGSDIRRTVWDSRQPARGELLRELARAYETLGALLTAARWGAFDLCDCGHVSIDHAVVRDGEASGWRPCTATGCDCLDYEDLDHRAHEFIEKRRRVEEAAEQRRAA